MVHTICTSSASNAYPWEQDGMRTCILRGVFVGSGSDGLAVPAVCSKILELAKSSLLESSDGGAPVAVYVGTATYDSAIAQERQTKQLEALGCRVVPLYVARHSSPHAVDITTAHALLQQAHIIVVSGGNTHFAIRRWNELGLRPHFLDAMRRGVVLAGGSAGAICWFDGGHSDSADPSTWFQGEASHDDGVASHDDAPAQSWKYIRVSGLSFFPGLVCPHHDQTQSNGIPRSVDFEQLLRRHAGEIGISIDHWAALIFNGDHYEIISINKEYPLSTVQLKRVQNRDANSVVETLPLPHSGKTKELLQALIPSHIQKDTQEDLLYTLNPVPQ